MADNLVNDMVSFICCDLGIVNVYLVCSDVVFMIKSAVFLLFHFLFVRLSNGT